MIIEDLLYSKDHEWLLCDESIGYIGISDFASTSLGDIVFVEILDNKVYNAGDVFGTIEAVKTVSDLFMPVSGTILEINQEVLNNPEILNSNPYTWIIKIQISDLNDIKNLMDYEEYKTLIS